MKRNLSLKERNGKIVQQGSAKPEPVIDPKKTDPKALGRNKRHLKDLKNPQKDEEMNKNGQVIADPKASNSLIGDPSKPETHNELPSNISKNVLNQMVEQMR